MGLGVLELSPPSGTNGDGKLTYHLGADYVEDPDGTFVS